MTETRRYDAWPPERIAAAALLAGRGLSHEEIAAHPRIDSTTHAVQRRLARLGIGEIEQTDTNTVRLPAAALTAFERAGKVRRMTPAAIAREILSVLGRDTALLDNVLDDGETTPCN